MKIGICGPSGSGKTTLAKFIAGHTDIKNGKINWVSNSARDLFTKEDNELLRSLGYEENSGHRRVIQLSNEKPEFGLTFQKLINKRRTEFIISNNDFVTDRTPVDNLVYFLFQSCSNQPDEIIQDMVSDCRAALGEFDVIFFTPYIEGNEVENNNSRVDSKYFQSMISGIFEDTIKKYFRDIFADDDGPGFVKLGIWDLRTRKDTILHTLIR